jgi:hypothetical protein
MLLRREIRSYLDRAEAQGSGGREGLQGVAINARFTLVSAYTVGADPTDWEATSGDVDLDFSLTVTDNLEVFIYATANAGGHFPSGFRSVAGASGSFGTPFGGATLSGIFDGIGVDGTVSPDPGSIRLDEGGMHWATAIGDHTLHFMTGKLDPRKHFAQNAFADDENTQFLNNLFDDPPAITWPTNASGRTIYGLHLWADLGGDEQYRIDVAFYNAPGQFFNDGQLFWQISWVGDLSGRETNLRVFGLFDFNTTDVTASFGLSWDWWATDRLGVFFRAAIHDNVSISEGETNHIESSWELGAVMNGLLPSRPDDQGGIAFGYIKGPVRAVLTTATENHEMVVELYYRYVREDGKFQLTPFVQFIIDPAAGTFVDDNLTILGFRIHVPF